MNAILRKVLVGLIAAGMLAVSTGVLVVSAAFALYALVRVPLGPAGGAAVVALAAAVVAGLTALAFMQWAAGPKRDWRAKAGGDQDLVQRLMSLAKERPIVSTGALIGAVTLAIRNPALTAIVVKAFLDPKKPQTKKAKS